MNNVVFFLFLILGAQTLMLVYLWRQVLMLWDTVIQISGVSAQGFKDTGEAIDALQKEISND